MTNLVKRKQKQESQSAIVLQRWAESVIAQVQSADDERIVEIARDAQRLEHAAFLVRGACAAEMKRRIKERSEFKSNQHSEEALKIGKEMLVLAEKIGVSVRTLDDDARIFETFNGAFRLGTESLERKYYQYAMTAPDPLKALSMAYEKIKQNPSYTTKDFQRDVHLLNPALALKDPAQQKKDADSYWLYAPLTEVAWQSLRTIRAREGCTETVAICRALEYFARKG